MEQLALVDMESGNAIAASIEYVETDYSFDQMIEIARHYGREIGRKNVSSAVNARIFGFVDGLAAVTELTNEQRELLRHTCEAAVWGHLSENAS